METGPTDWVLRTDLDSDYIDSGIKYMIDSHDSNISSSFVPASSSSENPVRFKMVQHLPWTPKWVVQHIKCDTLKDSLAVLRSWVPNSQQCEITEETIKEIRKLKMADALTAINNFKDKQ